VGTHHHKIAFQLVRRNQQALCNAVAIQVDFGDPRDASGFLQMHLRERLVRYSRSFFGQRIAQDRRVASIDRDQKMRLYTMFSLR